MKICDVVMNTIWFDPRVRKQIIEYKNHGFDVYGVGYNNGKNDKEKIASIPCQVTIADIPAKYKAKQRNPVVKLFREHLMNKAVEKAIIAYKPDIIHANDLNALIPSYAAARKLKCKIVYDSHEICTENTILINKKIYKLWFKYQERKIIKKVDQMICVSNAAAEYFAKTYNMEKPMVVTNCGFKSEYAEHNPKEGVFEVLNHGQFYAGRGYDIMVEAAKELEKYPEIRLAVRGMGMLEKSLKKRAEELELKNFSFYPPVLVNELISSAATSNVGVAITENICLNFELSVSNKIFEYMAAGLPVIMSDIPEHRYLNDKYKVGIVIKENTPKALAEAIVKLYTDKEFYEKCAKNARILSDEINWENEFKRLIDVEKALVK